VRKGIEIHIKKRSPIHNVEQLHNISESSLFITIPLLLPFTIVEQIKVEVEIHKLVFGYETSNRSFQQGRSEIR
jgi:hypothetical protein